MLYRHAMHEITWRILLRFINARFHIVRIFGVLFTINYSLVVVPIAVAVYSWPDFRLFCALMSFCMGIAASLLFHEICHALAGRCAGRHAREIGLLPIGGFTLFKQAPGGGWVELFIIRSGCVMDIPIALLMSVLIWCVSGMELMRIKSQASLLPLESCTVANGGVEACTKVGSMPPAECEAAVQ